MKTASYWTEKYKMQPHPEGGFFAESYRSTEIVSQEALPKRFSGERNFSTAIYFLLESFNFSAFHRIQSDEIWHFYTGNALEIIYIAFDGRLKTIRLGNNPDLGEVFQAVVPAGTWFASRVACGGNFALVGCTVSPGFDFADFEMATRKELLENFPAHHSVILELTRA